MRQEKLSVRITHSGDMVFSEELQKKQRRGNILHLAISFIKTLKEINQVKGAVIKAMALLGEKPSLWNIEEEFVNPLKSILKNPECSEIFSPEAEEVLREKSIVLPGTRNEIFENKLVRPDRIVVLKDKIIVVDFKSIDPESSSVLKQQKAQVTNYSRTVGQIFNQKSVEGYLLYILSGNLIKVI